MTPTPSRPFPFNTSIPFSKGPSLLFSSSTGHYAHSCGSARNDLPVYAGRSDAFR